MEVQHIGKEFQFHGCDLASNFVPKSIILGMIQTISNPSTFAEMRFTTAST